MFEKVKGFFEGLSDYSKAVVPNFRPTIKVKEMILPQELYQDSIRFKGIVIHHSATVDGKLNDWAGIRKYHMSYRIDGTTVDEATFKSRQMMGSGKTFEKPWIDIAYDLGIEWDGGEVKYKLGRSWKIPGAHAGMHKNGKSYNKFNEEYFGICVIGNFDATTPDAELWAKTVAVVKEICGQFGIDKKDVIGHREAYDRISVPRQKTCPGTKFSMDEMRNQL